MKTERKSFFLAMKNLPTTTHQEKQVHVVNGKPHFYEPYDLKAARVLFMEQLAPFVPAKKFKGPIRLITKWCFGITGSHYNGEYKTTAPDTDNIIKLLKDCMTKSGFWKNDAEVASEVTEKFWADVPGIFVVIEEIAQPKHTK